MTNSTVMRNMSTWMKSLVMVLLSWVFVVQPTQAQILLNEDFETSGGVFPSGWTLFTEGTGNPWTINNATSSPTPIPGSVYHMRYGWHSSQVASAWAITPQLEMEVGKTYVVKFTAAAASNTTYIEKLRVTIGSGITAGSQTTTLIDIPAVPITQTEYSIQYTPTSDGIYYVGFYCYSGSNQFNLNVDNIIVKEAVEVDAAPINLNATSITGTGLTLNWVDNSTNELGFKVYMSTNGVDFVQYGGVENSTTYAGTGTTYSRAITGLVPGSTYYFKVGSFNDTELQSGVFTAVTNAAPVYVWTGTTSQVYANPGNWSPERTSPSTYDVLIFDGTEFTGGDISVTGFANQTVGQVKVINGAQVTFAASTSTQTLTMNGGDGTDFYVEAGSSFTFGGTASTTLAFASAGAPHTAVIDGTLATGITATFTLNSTNSVWQVNGTLTLGSNTNTISGDAATRFFNAGSNVNITSNSVIIPSGTWHPTATLNLTGNTTATSTTFGPGQSASYPLGNVNVNYTGTSTATLTLFAAGYSIGGNLTINNTGTAGKFRLTTSSTVTVEGNVTVNGGTFEVMGGAGNVTIKGDVIVNDGTLNLNGATTASAGTMNIAKLFTINGGSVIKSSTSATHYIVLNGTTTQSLDLPSGIVTSIRVLNAEGAIINANIGSGAVLDIRNGNVIGGTITYAATGSTLSYTGTTNQFATLVEFPATDGPFALIINNTGTAPDNVVTIPYNRSLGSTSTNTGTVLTLTNGVLNNTGYTLTVQNTNTTAINTPSAGRYITGKLARVIPANLTTNATYLFPVGKSGSNSFELVNPNTTTDGQVTVAVEVVDGDMGGTAGSSLRILNTARYWSAEIVDGAANFTNSNVRLNDTRGAFNVVGQSATANGTYELAGGFPATLTSSSILTIAPKLTSLGYFVMAEPGSPEFVSISISPDGSLCTNAARIVTAEVEQGGAAITSVTLKYQVNSGTAVDVVMTNTSGNIWEGTIPTVTPANATVTYTIVAADASGLSTTSAAGSYKDEPLFNVNLTANASTTNLCLGQNVDLSYTLTGSIPYGRVGTGSTTTSGQGITPFSSAWEGQKTQYLVRASDLLAAGYSAGNINTMSFFVTSPSTTPMLGYTVKMATTVLDALSSSFVNTSFQTVYGPSSLTVNVPANNWMPINFSNSFAWDGTSNILIEICFEIDPTGSCGSCYGSSSTVAASTTSYNSVYGVYQDNAPTCSTGGSAISTFTTRPDMKFDLPSNTEPIYSWSDGTNTVGNTANITVAPTEETTYTLTIQYGSACSKTASVLVNVNELPEMPIASYSTQCGFGVPEAFVVSDFVAPNVSTGAFRWYDAPTGGNLLQTGGSTYTGSINSTTTFYVSEYNGTCESPRVAVVATVNDPDPITITASATTICIGAEVELGVSSSGDNQTYAYTWSANAAGGVPADAPGSTLIVEPTTAGTHTYTVTAVDGTCTVVETIDITVNPLPYTPTVIATPAEICEGTSTTLTADPVETINKVGTLGTGATTAGQFSYPSPFGNYYGGAKHQMLYRAADLQAQGLSAGPIVSIAFDVSTARIQYGLSDFTVKMGTTSLNELPSTFQGGLTTVFNRAVYGPSVTPGYDANTIELDSPFNWDGTSNIIIEICFNNNANYNSNGNSEFRSTTTTGYNSVLYFRADASSTLCNTNSGTASTLRPNTRFRQAIPNDHSSDLTFSWQPGDLTGASIVVSPTEDQTYTLTTTSTSTGCSNTTTVDVTVYPAVPAPTANHSSHCGMMVPYATVTSNSGAATPYFKWYDAETDGNVVLEGNYDSWPTAVATNQTWWVSEVSEFGCESPRVELTVSVMEADPVSAQASSLSICFGESVTLEAIQDGFTNFYDFTWTATQGGGIDYEEYGQVVEVTPTETGSIVYTVFANDFLSGCQTYATVTVNVTPIPFVNSISATPETICAGSTSTLTAKALVPVQKVVQMGTETTSTASWAITPLTTLYEDQRSQYLINAEELTAMNVSPGPITSIAFNITTAGATANGFTIKMGLTSTQAFTTENVYLPSPTNVVYGPQNFTPTVGWKTFNLSTPLIWDGTSAILIEVCFNNTSWSSSSAVETSVLSYKATLGGYDDDIDNTCESTAFSLWVTEANQNIRPNFRLNALVIEDISEIYTWEWNPGALTGNTVEVTATETTEYTVSVTDAQGCHGDATITLNVLDLPAMPVVVDSDQCGEGIPTATVTGTGGTLKWYDAETGGNLIQEGGSTYLQTINETTTFYVSEHDGTCEGPRAAVTVTVTQPDPVSIDASSVEICLGESITLDASSEGSYNTYNYTWSATPSAGSGLVGGETGASIGFTPDAPGTYVYTVTANDPVENCNTSSNITVVVKELPTITAVTAEPSDICAGAVATLHAKSYGDAQNITVGAGVNTSSSTGTPFYGGWGGTKVSYIYTAAELTALGFSEGMINSLSLDVSTTATTIYQGFKISMGTTTLNEFPSASPAHPSTTQDVFMGNIAPNNGYQNTSGTGIITFNFTSPFYWDGNSNLVVSMCYSNSNTSNTAMTLRTDNQTNYRTLYTYADNRTAAQVCATVTGAVDNGSGSTSGGTSRSQLRPKMIFNVNTINSSLNWIWSPGGSTANPLVVAPTTTTTYSVTAVNPVTGCTSEPSTVTVNVLPLTLEVSTDEDRFCVGGTANLTVTATGGQPLSYVWSDGVEVIGSTNTIAVSPTTTTTYTVTVTDACGNSETESVTITVDQLPGVSIEEEGTINLCTPATQVLTAVNEDEDVTLQWLNGGVAIVGETGDTYTVTESGVYSILATNTVTGCTYTTEGVTVNINPLPEAFTFVPADPNVCDGTALEMKVLTSNASSGTIGTGNITNTGTSSTSPFKGWYGGTKTQHLYTAAELTALGLTAGSSITELSMLISSFTGPYTFNNYTISMRNTTATSLATAFQTGMTTVFGPTSYTLEGTAPFTVTHTLTTPFVWDGTSNIVVQFCFSNYNSGGVQANIGEVRATTVTGGARYQSVDGTTTDNCANSGGTSSTARINLGFTFTSHSAEWSPTTGLYADAAATVPYDGSSVAKVYAMPDANTTYTATITNTYGCTTSQTVDVTVNPALTVGSEIVGPTNATAHVAGFPAATYTIATTNETSITWNIPAGATNVVGQGTNTISFNYPNFYTGTISVTVEGMAGCEAITRTLNIIFDCPGAPVVEGPENVCPYVGSGEEVTYSVVPDPSIASYVWTLPPNVTLVSGQGTGSITVTFGTAFANQANKQIRVVGVSGCGNTTQTIYYLKTHKPTSAGPITGPVDACSFIGSDGLATYSISNVEAAESYLWSVPAGATIVSGQGTTSIEVSFDLSYNTGLITVYAVNGCGTSTPRSITVSRTSPSIPSLVSGPNNACMLMPSAGNPTGTEAVYTVTAQAGVTYNWIVPAGVDIVSGQGTNSITVLFTGSYSGGNLYVYASTNCGTSGMREFALNRVNPQAPGAIDAVQIGECPERMYQYTLNTMPSNTTWLEWEVPAGATIVSGQGTTSIVVSYPTTALSGQVKVVAQNGCGNSSVRTINVKLAGCNVDPEQPGEQYVKGEELAIPPVDVNGLSLNVRVFPNPSTNYFNVEVKSDDMKSKVVIRILDNVGRVMEVHEMRAGEVKQAGHRLRSGSYFIEAVQGNERVTQKVMKF